MKSFTIYNSVGKILRSGTCSAGDFTIQAQAGEYILESPSDGATQYVYNGAVVTMPPKPSDNHVFNYSSQQWDIDYALAEVKARGQRNYLLTTVVDSINAVRWNNMTEGQQQAWSDYRRALLDVPSQAGFPLNIQWPVTPTN